MTGLLQLTAAAVAGSSLVTAAVMTASYRRAALQRHDIDNDIEVFIVQLIQTRSQAVARAANRTASEQTI